MSSLQVSSHILEPSEECPYFIAAKCYSSSKNYSAFAADALTFVVAHATGMHKECWEPVIEKLFAATEAQQSGTKIREVWCIDAPNHGEAAVLNERFLRTHWLEEFPWDEYGRAIGYFLTAGINRGGHVDFTERKLCALGHSMGAVALVWLQQSPIPVHFQQMILCEPMISPPGVDIFPRGAFVIPASYQRRDVWSSRQAALKDFNSSKGYASWNPRILELFVQHALREHPASKIAIGPFKGVTLACDRFHEAACYRGGIPLGSTISPRLAEVSYDIPVSLVFGAVEDSVELKVKKALANSSVSDLRCASVHWVEKAGHLVVQNSPHGTAEAILDVLSQVPVPTQTKSKL
ncbi:hypothetical protein M407DRAFT_23626 [Tulasnella calospora MUT 4182]|uniref:AB hydrolase-1 domain-containing protein n=1 Tax=Tulasnella calospora MUT 4182 TaxID=1051891 RepID=A0A0C3QKT4_9AGAM|nr:hypothetical protein M407DRAFT_23626 [Tulasnella calospora MUT 4182]